ncbi:MAG: hypothetical protein Harvfovirus5_49 [Harvfovirus sp.]|uniref:Uncharacterized protein n=1 Tax=Harvfovirus sp. TaxID=2487768 RepID=A0A3G5A0M8_9VIRU|nr:MAG: hypothetical protein Harvfovirus5_49 [Harvfovirus sp.]
MSSFENPDDMASDKLLTQTMWLTPFRQYEQKDIIPVEFEAMKGTIDFNICLTIRLSWLIEAFGSHEAVLSLISRRTKKLLQSDSKIPYSVIDKEIFSDINSDELLLNSIIFQSDDPRRYGKLQNKS